LLGNRQKIGVILWCKLEMHHSRAQ